MEVNAGEVLPAAIPADLRVPVGMELRFSYRNGDITYLGTGRAWNLSAETVYFEIDQEVCGWKNVELRIEWPARLQQTCALELVLRGRIIRKGPNFAVLRRESYEFRTCGDHSFSSLNHRGVTCDIAA